ncbi:MAG: Hsp20/alpha crystallin family protein [Bacteroidia bacterium]|nr:Hsp20/alpha crystallin family protein [Bacteroidia bacterium]MDW8157323.1 Hsp20/alpha crystallin family protein [Bacteroidia bacterium]
MFSIYDLGGLNLWAPFYFQDAPTGDPRESSRLLPVDILEDNQSIQLWAYLPGAGKTDFNVEVDHNTYELRIRGERKNPSQGGALYFRKQEMEHGIFERRFTLSKELDVDNISASYEDGVLKIKIPRLQKITKVVSVM